MKIVWPNALFLCFVIGVCLASAAFGQTIVNFGITSAGPNNLADIYTDPYNGVVNGTPVLAFCDDFTDEISPPESWTAYDTNLSQLPDSPTTVYFSGGTVYGTTYSETTEYIAAAMLAMQSLQTSDVNTQNELSFALWDIFDPNVFGTNASNPILCPYGCMTSTQADAAVSDVQSALTAAAALTTKYGATAGVEFEALNNVSVNIYTPETNGVAGKPAAEGPQEFITVKTPEPSGAAILGFDLLSVLAGIYLVRRYRVRA